MSEKKKQVFIVTSGSYSDYRIEAVFSTKALAEAYVRDVDLYEGHIEVWDLDAANEELEQLRAGKGLYHVRMERDGTVTQVERVSKPCSYDLKSCREKPSLYAFGPINAKPPRPRSLSGKVIADHDMHAVKIMNEYRTRLIAEGEWE